MDKANTSRFFVFRGAAGTEMFEANAIATEVMKVMKSDGGGF